MLLPFLLILWVSKELTVDRGPAQCFKTCPRHKDSVMDKTVKRGLSQVALADLKTIFLVWGGGGLVGLV